MPTTSTVPLLSLDSRKSLQRSAAKRRCIKHSETDVQYVIKRLKRRRSNHGLPVDSSDDLIQKLQEMDKAFQVAKNMRSLCRCWSCQHLRRWSSSFQPYQCNFKWCMIAFESFIDMYEHQLTVHGRLNPKTGLVVCDTYRQQRGTLAYPPATVYAAQQHMCPSCPPVPWKSIDELDGEAQVVRDKLSKYNSYCFETLYKLFKIGYKLVKQNGWNEMLRQYQIAMEYYYSGLKFPASSRRFHDGCPSVEQGRNWLTSTDREDARSLFPISVSDSVIAESEFVLIDTKRDQTTHEKCIEIRDDTNDKGLLTRATTHSNVKSLENGF
ncbi:uncharacterized protein CCR75_000227 [Bremia lactucae]|uniref:C2H2-type domain-containing protein n=1 Tax=Bremia lactucae TaxID=4779 RepID=A0A976FEE4_BRELC|nr:hypothetical protein CCR75_000227 [Bremia lactucae]